MSKCVMGCILSAVMVLASSAQVSPKPTRTAAEIEPLLVSVAKYEYGQSREAQAQFTQLVQDSLASPAMLKQIEARLLAFLGSSATAAAKQFALRELSLIGTEASVPALAPMLLDPATSEMARFALARIPGTAAGQALRDSLGKASGKIGVGIIGSLGQRRDTKAVPALAAIAASSDQQSAQAALAVLGEIADRPALMALATLHAKTSGVGAAHAYLNCANRIAVEGDKESALKVYRELAAAKEPPQVRVAALTGLASLNPKEAMPLLVRELESKDASIQFASIRLLGGIPGNEVTAAMQRIFPNLSPAGKVRLLSALADRGDRSSHSLFARAAKDATPEVRTAALHGLGAMGDAGDIVVLADAAATGQTVEQAAARLSLRDLRGAAIDPALVAAIGSSQGKVKTELILAAGDRGMTAAADAVVAAMGAADADVRREASRAARNVAGPAQVPALLNLTMSASNEGDRGAVSQALAAALQKSGTEQVLLAVSAYRRATAVEPRIALLHALGQTSSSDALPLLRASMADPAPDIVRAGILALSDWKNPVPLPDLLAVAKANPNPAVQVLGLRGYFKLVGLSSQRPHVESARLLREAAGLAKQPAEKRTLLSLLGNYPCKESLEIVESIVKDESVANEVKAAVDKINRAMR